LGGVKTKPLSHWGESGDRAVPPSLVDLHRPSLRPVTGSAVDFTGRLSVQATAHRGFSPGVKWPALSLLPFSLFITTQGTRPGQSVVRYIILTLPGESICSSGFINFF